MMKLDRRPAGLRAGLAFLVVGIALGLVLGGVPVSSAKADDAPADTTKAAEATKATETTKETTKEEAKEGTKKETKEAGAKKEKSTKTKAAKKADAKGGAVAEGTKTAPGTMPVKPAVEPEHVQVQHILIGFAGSIPGKGITRTKEEAKKLAYEILEKARSGEDFDALVRQYTEDSPPGIYGMSGKGVSPGQGEYPRDQMVPAFGNVGFAISPGNIGIADYDPQTSPYGWHIIKRLK